MKCPFCGYTESKVIDSRPAEEGATIRRRRECLACQKRFTTYEIIERLPLVVVKRDGSRQSFDKVKLITWTKKDTPQNTTLDVYKNRDYYAFLTHLAGKSLYSVKEITENAETFLEEMVASGMTEDELEEFEDISFKIEFGSDLVQMKADSGSTDDIAEITDMTFVKL